MVKSPFLLSDRLALRHLTLEDATERYANWLNDPECLKFRGPKAFPTDMVSLKHYLENIAASGDLRLAVCIKDTGEHIGNVALNSILWVHGSAELSILIGAKHQWGKGYGKEVIQAVSKHAFGSMGLRRLWAESPNPSFNSAVKALNWAHEGKKRKAFLLEGQHVDIECWGLLKEDFKC